MRQSIDCVAAVIFRVLEETILATLEEMSKRKSPTRASRWKSLWASFAVIILATSQGMGLFVITTVFHALLLATEYIIEQSFTRLQTAELPNRLKQIYAELGEFGMEYGKVQEPPSRAINLARVRRDDDWCLLPVNLLVEGDIFQLSPDDDLGISCKKITLSGASNNWFKVSQTPLKCQLESLSEADPTRVPWKNHFQSMITWLYISIFFFSLLASYCIYFDILDESTCRSMILGFSGSIFLVSPLWIMLFYCFGNARLIALSEVLQRSKTPYLEAEDVDEFDEEAPPPTKDIYLDPFDILRTIKAALQQKLDNFLFWRYNLVDSFSSVSVLSFLDREGPIANSFPVPLEVVFPNPKTEGELAFGEFIMDPSNLTLMRTNYAHPKISDDDLRALGLSLLVSASCGVHNGQFRRDWHVRFPWSVHPGRKLDPVFRTCTCTVSRELGFHARSINNYSRILDFWVVRDVGISTALRPVEYQGLFSRIFLDRTRDETHMFSFGDLTSMACLSKYTWNARNVGTMPEVLRKKLIDLDDNLAASDLQCIGLSYKPVLIDRSKLPHFKDSPHVLDFTSVTDDSNKTEIANLARYQIFLGTLISGYVPKEDMQELIDDLENSGIRFVYFSPYSESITKAFGDRLGLETDWNSCIILSRGTNTEISDFTDPKSKLPRGVHNIRPHLANVDDIPLQLSLFAECSPESVAEMNRIYAENGEFVISIGSTLNWSNSSIFASTRVSIGMEPPNLRTPAPSGRISSMYLSAALTSLSTPIILPFDCSPYVLTEIIREARCLSRGSTFAFFYCLCMAESLCIAVTFGILSFWPLLCAMIIILITIFGFIIAPYEPNILKLMPKQPWNHQYQGSQRNLYGIRSIMNGTILVLASRIIPSPLLPMAMSLIVLAISSTCLHGHLDLYNFGPFQHTYWLYTTLSIAASICAITFYQSRDLEVHAYLVTICQIVVFVILAVVVNEFVKYLWHLDFERCEKRAKLHFNTKLGMHSPV